MVEEYLETHPLEVLYDDVLIPALTAAKRDRELGTLTEEDVHFIIQATRAIVEDLNPRPPHPLTPATLTTTSATTEVVHDDATASDSGLSRSRCYR